jgi:hypothetical protein
LNHNVVFVVATPRVGFASFHSFAVFTMTLLFKYEEVNL